MQREELLAPGSGWVQPSLPEACLSSWASSGVKPSAGRCVDRTLLPPRPPCCCTLVSAMTVGPCCSACLPGAPESSPRARQPHGHTCYPHCPLLSPNLDAASVRPPLSRTLCCRCVMHILTLYLGRSRRLLSTHSKSAGCHPRPPSVKSSQHTTFPCCELSSVSPHSCAKSSDL